MPTGPNGQKRPTEAHRCAIMVAKLSTGEREEILEPATPTNKARHRPTQQPTKEKHVPMGRQETKTSKIVAKD
jgi:hypothetical protein